MSTKKLVYSGLFVAFGVVLGSVVSIPVGIAKIFPVQHLINVLSVVLIGPVYAIINAFVISLIRNLIGVGTLLAFPGSMIGAALAGIIYYVSKNDIATAVGEVIGTGILGSLLSIPIAKLFMGKSLGAAVLMPSFILSSLSGAILAVIILKLKPVQKFKGEQNEIHR